MAEERDFKGVWIPREIYLSEYLSWAEKILLIEIDSLDRGGGCFARNAHLGDFLGVSGSRIANMLTKLRKMGLVIDVSFDGRKRYIRVSEDFQSLLRQGSRFYEGRLLDSVKGKPPKIPNGAELSSPKSKGATPSNTVSNTVSTSVPFPSFWSTYPKKVERKKCEQRWSKLPLVLQEEILKDIPLRLKGEKWSKEGGRFIENPMTYLNGERWNDEITPAKVFKKTMNNVSVSGEIKL